MKNEAISKQASPLAAIRVSAEGLKETERFLSSMPLDSNAPFTRTQNIPSDYQGSLKKT